MKARFPGRCFQICALGEEALITTALGNNNKGTINREYKTSMQCSSPAS